MSANKRRGDVEDKEQLEFQKILENLLKEPDNKKCADCATAAPRWASANLGVFLCIKCSGIHRAMGTHISFVRSVSLDRWKPEEIAFMQSMGNANAALSWEARLPAEYKRPSPNDGIALQKFIRDKYEHKRYFKAVEKATQPKIEIYSQNGSHTSSTTTPAAPVVNTSTILQPPRASSTPPLQQPRTNAPLRSRPADPVLVDPFTNSSTSQPVKQELENNFFSNPSKPDPVLFNPGQQQQQVQAQPSAAPAVDVNLVKKSNIMSMFDVQPATTTPPTQQMQQMQAQQMQQMQQMYYATPTQLYYSPSTSGGYVPVMYCPPIQGGQTPIYSSPVVYFPGSQ
jgi:stromal membrane-associated protein